MGKISQLFGYTTPQTTDYMPIVQASGPSLLRVTLANLITLFYNNMPANWMSAAKFYNPYKFSAYQSGAQTLTAGAVPVMQFNTEDFDTNSNYNNSTYTYTVPATGYYFINSRINITTGAAAGNMVLMINKNGAEVRREQAWVVASKVFSMNISELIYLTANDTIAIAGYIDGANATVTTGASNNHFSIHLVSIA